MSSLTSLPLLVAQSAVGQVPSIPQNPRPGAPTNTTTTPGSTDVFRQIAEDAINTSGTEQPGIADIEILGNETLRSGQIERDMNALNQNLINSWGHRPGELRLTRGNGYQRPGDTGTYYWSPGFIHYSGGTVTLPNGETRNYNPSVRILQDTRNSGSYRWLASPTPPPHVLALAQLNLIPTADGKGLVFYRPGAGNSGNYHLAPNGQIWFEGGHINGAAAGAQTYVNGAWRADLTARPTGMDSIHGGGFLPNHDGTWRCPGCGDSLHVMPNGNLLNINRDGTEAYFLWGNRNSRRLTAAELNSAEVRAGIQAIQASRTARGFTY
jgi:hypothetical protein